MTPARDRNDADGHRGGVIRRGRMCRNDDVDKRDDDRCSLTTRNAARRVDDDAVERSLRLDDDVNKPIGDALFRNIDACMLVYDAT